MDVQHSQLGAESMEKRWRQSFGKNVSYLHRRGNWKKLDETSVDLMSYNMAVDFDMFGAFMEDRIRSYLNGGTIVTVKCSWLNERYSKILENVSEPLYFTSSGCESPILGFRRTRWDGGLLLRLPRYKRRTKVNGKTSNGSASVPTASPVRVTESTKLRSAMSRKEKTWSGCAFKIA